MNNWMKTLPAIVLAIAGVAFLVLAWVGPLIDGTPAPEYKSIAWGISFVTFGVLLFVRFRRIGGGAGPPNA